MFFILISPRKILQGDIFFVNDTYILVYTYICMYKKHFFNNLNTFFCLDLNICSCHIGGLIWWNGIQLYPRNLKNKSTGYELLFYFHLRLLLCCISFVFISDKLPILAVISALFTLFYLGCLSPRKMGIASARLAISSDMIADLVLRHSLYCRICFITHFSTYDDNAKLR